MRVEGEAWTQVVHGTTSAAPRQAHGKHEEAPLQEKQALLLLQHAGTPEMFFFLRFSTIYTEDDRERIQYVQIISVSVTYVHLGARSFISRHTRACVLSCGVLLVHTRACAAP